MASLVRRATLFALYQLSIVLGLALLPIALLARWAEVALPVHRLVSRLGDAHEHATS